MNINIYGGAVLEKKVDTLIKIGLLIYIACLLVDGFITKVPYGLAIPIATLGVILVVIGTIKVSRG